MVFLQMGLPGKRSDRRAGVGDTDPEVRRDSLSRSFGTQNDIVRSGSTAVGGIEKILTRTNDSVSSLRDLIYQVEAIS